MAVMRKTITFTAIAILATVIGLPSADSEGIAAKKQYMGYGNTGYGLGYGLPAYGTPGYIAPGAPPSYGNPALMGGPYGGLVPPYPGNYGGYGGYPQQPYPQVYPPPYQQPYGMYQQPSTGYYPGVPGYPGMGEGMVAYSAKNQPAHRENA